MAHGFQNKTEFTNLLTSDQRKLAERLSEIEKEDSDRCANCGGEDCMCCEIYHDRQKWVSPQELFSEMDEMYGREFEPYEYEEE